jgi:hypothetical protein
VSGQTLPAAVTFSRVPADVDGFDALAELALDMRWSWNHATDELWRQLDSELWHSRPATFCGSDDSLGTFAYRARAAAVARTRKEHCHGR